MCSVVRLYDSIPVCFLVPFTDASMTDSRRFIIPFCGENPSLFQLMLRDLGIRNNQGIEFVSRPGTFIGHYQARDRASKMEGLTGHATSHRPLMSHGMPAAVTLGGPMDVSHKACPWLHILGTAASLPLVGV